MVYKKAKVFNDGIRKFLFQSNLDNTTKDQLRGASLSIVLNIAGARVDSQKPTEKIS